VDKHLIQRLEKLLDRIEQLVPPVSLIPNWQSTPAALWQKNAWTPIKQLSKLQLNDLQHIEEQKKTLDRNTRQFLKGLPANNALLWGSKGTGKSSLIKALLNTYHSEGLRLIEVDKQHLADLPLLTETLSQFPQRFIIFSDDLSFEASDAGYKALKSVLDGSINVAPENVLIYATSNRRHLMPEFGKENIEMHWVNDELHPGETSEEKISLSERFGLWLSFYPFNQDHYLAIVDYWLKYHGLSGICEINAREAALQWALLRGSRSGRAAMQFVRDWVGTKQLHNNI
jgi:predicted AAA+ superfamily ATPase